MPQASAPLRWHAYEHEHIERGSDWFWALGIFAQSPPPLIEFELSDRGIRAGAIMHRYEEIISFWVEDHDADPPILLVDTTKWMSPNLIIPLTDMDPKQVRAYLLERSEEVPMKEPVAHKILEFFGL